MGLDTFLPFLLTFVFSHFLPHGNTFPARPTLFGGWGGLDYKKSLISWELAPLFKCRHFSKLGAPFKKSSLQGDQMG